MSMRDGLCNHPDCKEFGRERFSLGIYAGFMCDEHWESSGYRKEGPEGFDPLDAGESYEEE
jgi:hypothetical protein